MDRHELNRMFDALAPDPKRERELLGQLLQDDARRTKPMKNWKRVVFAVAAAALLVTAAAAAVVLPRIDDKVLDYVGVDPEDTQAVEEAVDLLYPGAMALDITKESNGATLHVTQILRDRYTVMILADFTAPEGTVLGPEFTEKQVPLHRWSFTNGSDYSADYLDESGERIRDGLAASYRWEVLEDNDPADNRLTLIFTLYPQMGEESAIQEAAFVRVPAVNLGYSDWEEGRDITIWSGDWSFEASLPQRDIGYTQTLEQAIGELDGADVTMGELYLSPVSLEFMLTREGGVDLSSWTEENQAEQVRWHSLASDAHCITLTTKDGETVAVQFSSGGGMGINMQALSFRLLEITDPAKFQGGTLTLDWACGRTVISLDNLKPVEPTALAAE